MHNTELSLGLLIVLCCVLLIPFFVPHIALPTFLKGAIDDEYKEGTILFVGDILLGRHVENLMETHGEEYPFREIQNLVASVDVAVANFEAAVPKMHKKTEDFTFTFSVKKEYLHTLKTAGFDVLSLANNHAYDFGNQGYEHTLASCSEAELLCNGHPYLMHEISLRILPVGDALVGIVFLHGLSTSKDDPLFGELMALAKANSDVQIAFVHWGEEYELVHGEREEKLAHALIENGAEAVIGHHPHVVQDIELYNGKPIFYSLGNFIFDQYFSDAVTTGLAVQLTIAKDALSYTLIPVTSKDTKSQPRLMAHKEKEAFLSSLVYGEGFERITAELPRLSVAR